MTLDETPQPMNGTYTRQPDPIGPMHVVLIFLVAGTVGAGALLLSAAESTTLVDGAIEWRVESPLRAVVQLLCLNYRFPTIHAGAVKNCILGVGAGLAILVLAVAIIAKRQGSEDAAVLDDPATSSSAGIESTNIRVRHKGHIPPLLAAQLLVGLFLLWSFASSRWSAAPDLAVGGSMLLTIHFLWAIGIGNGLNRSAAVIASRILMVVAALTACVALWYYFGRNPTLRAKFPYGNPTFLAACLIPGITLAVTLLVESSIAGVRKRKTSYVLVGLIALGIVIVTSWAFHVTGSRGALVGLGAALLAVMFFGLRGRARLIPVLLVLGALFWTQHYFASSDAESLAHGRSATLRLRGHSWRYAWEMFREKPLTGHGQGGFVLAGDAHAVNDVLIDPLPFAARIAHVHNEWLEVLADLGSIGFVLLTTALGLTLYAGKVALEASLRPSERWVLIGLMGALVGLTVEEAFGVGLRVSGVPTLFFTVVGLIWAVAARRSNALPAYLAGKKGRRVATGVVGIATAVVVLAVTQHDFIAARNAYAARAALKSGDDLEAVRLATSATTSRLNPQRTLENLARLSEAQMLVAARLQDRAIDRETRARRSDLFDPQLLALAQQDRAYSDHHCKEGNRALKELVARSPAYFNHGRIEYELNLIQAGNAAARDDREEHDQRIKNAAAAIERELRRRPFDPSITLDYLSVTDGTLDLAQSINTLARPLRHNRIVAPYVDYLSHLTTLPDFEVAFQRIVQDAYDAVTALQVPNPADQSAESWAPEKLRLAAAVQFRRGNYAAAREALKLAARVYETLAASAPIAAASCYAELADCQFYAEPEKPHVALTSGYRAIALAPESLMGRRLKRNVQHRMVDYYLAADDEDQAERVLTRLAPARATAEAIRSALGVRYRDMCEALRDRRLAQILRKPVNELLPKLERWATRAIELNADDYRAHYLAADLAFHGGDCEATARHLIRAIESGLAFESAEKFLRAARGKRPDCQALEQAWIMLTTPQQPDTPADEVPGRSDQEIGRRTSKGESG